MKIVLSVFILSLLVHQGFLLRRIEKLEKNSTHAILYTAKISTRLARRSREDDLKWQKVETFVNGLSKRTQDTARWCEEVNEIARGILSQEKVVPIVVPENTVESF